MEELSFWNLITVAKEQSQNDPDTHIAHVVDALSALSEADIIAFATIFDCFMALSYTRELWAAAYIIQGGCSDDCFDYFRGWLIAQGETVFYNALRDPECLIDVQSGADVELEGMLTVADSAYEQKTGKPLPALDTEPWVLNGELWDDDVKYATYPKLAAKFG